jgi:hypothetical protein
MVNAGLKFVDLSSQFFYKALRMSFIVDLFGVLFVCHGVLGFLIYIAKTNKKSRFWRDLMTL